MIVNVSVVVLLSLSVTVTLKLCVCSEPSSGASINGINEPIEKLYSFKPLTGLPQLIKNKSTNIPFNVSAAASSVKLSK